MSDQKTTQIIRDWERAQKRVTDAKSELNGAECSLANATSALGRWIAPDNAISGETFNIWIDGRLLSVTKQANGASGDYKIEWRKGKTGDKLVKPNEMADSGTAAHI